MEEWRYGSTILDLYARWRRAVSVIWMGPRAVPKAAED
jgi:hypothetical protein